ncbi:MULTISPECIES: hypothetical protein [Pseudomonas]|jgi:hypothetical protein|uniref:Uncharacterized protein n=1 Tax=Pseudomonas fluorescens TaxID=294 RepID=A0A0F4TPF9_PSEFL|nr:MULTISPECIES: hypothetical protein [Pseudomonas]KJZ45287.1 hypothetical protein VC35_14550 [Pseudomonas fluorescens]MBI3905701.1 hypothetical protein [Pseudomonas fluorescens]
MTSQKFSTKPKTSYYFTVKQNCDELFNADTITVNHHEGEITIEGSKNLFSPNGRAINLIIDSSTPNGEQVFVRGQRLKDVFYLNGGEKNYANEGTFKSYLDIPTKKYWLSFKLKFHNQVDEIEGELEVTG